MAAKTKWRPKENGGHNKMANSDVNCSASTISEKKPKKPSKMCTLLRTHTKRQLMLSYIFSYH